jgi:hypothetical protein
MAGQGDVDAVTTVGLETLGTSFATPRPSRRKFQPKTAYFKASRRFCGFCQCRSMSLPEAFLDFVSCFEPASRRQALQRPASVLQRRDLWFSWAHARYIWNPWLTSLANVVPDDFTTPMIATNGIVVGIATVGSVKFGVCPHRVLWHSLAQRLE